MANKSEPDSITIIEDCLNRIYLARRANLMNKARKFKEKQARRAFSDTGPPPVAKAAYVNDDALSDYAEGSVLEELGAKYKAPPTVAVPYVKEDSHIAQKYHQQDEEAHDLFVHFCDDLSSLIDDAPMRIPDDDFRADNCDVLIQKYLTNKMDKMMATKTLSKIRKHISTIIEQFASSDNTDLTCKIMDAALKDCRDSFGSPRAGKQKSAPNDSNATGQTQKQATVEAPQQSLDKGKNAKLAPKEALIQSATTNNNVAAAPPPANSNNAAATKASAKAAAVAEGPSAGERQKAEKQRIKAQYEQLMTIKKKAENHPDDETIHQYSALHADIQSVIDSINVNKAK